LNIQFGIGKKATDWQHSMFTQKMIMAGAWHDEKSLKKSGKIGRRHGPSFVRILSSTERREKKMLQNDDRFLSKQKEDCS
jgi:hypothetical protein